MSIACTPLMDNPLPQDPGERFDDLLFDNPEICSQCFAHIRDREEHDLNRLGNRNRPTETLERAGKGIVGQAIDHDEDGPRQSYRARTYCGECGRQSGRADGDHIHSLQSLRNCCDAIARRLHEAGYYPDLDRLYATAVTLKRKPSYQGKDREILAVAVYLALESGGERPGPGGVPTVGPPPSRRPRRLSNPPPPRDPAREGPSLRGFGTLPR
jgi:hypothetical protein